MVCGESQSENQGGRETQTNRIRGDFEEKKGHSNEGYENRNKREKRTMSQREGFITSDCRDEKKEEKGDWTSKADRRDIVGDTENTGHSTAC